jgi:hypothetical protein
MKNKADFMLSRWNTNPDFLSENPVIFVMLVWFVVNSLFISKALRNIV